MLIYMIKTKGTNDGRTGFRSRFVYHHSYRSPNTPSHYPSSSFFLFIYLLRLSIDSLTPSGIPLQEQVEQESKSTPSFAVFREESRVAVGCVVEQCVMQRRLHVLDFVGGRRERAPGGMGRYGVWQEGWIGLDGEGILFSFFPSSSLIASTELNQAC